MFSTNYYNNDSDDLTVHYRAYKSPSDGQLYVVCLQNFDYPDYDEDGFIDEEFFLYEPEAERHVKQLKNPDEFIPGLYDTRYRLYTNDNDENVVVTIEADYEYENYDTERFLDDRNFRTYEEADNALFWM